MKKSKYNKYGISLITLVVTIIIILILTSVSIGLILQNGGIINQAKKTNEETIVANDMQQIQLFKLENGISASPVGEKLKNIEFNILEDTKSIYDSETGTTYGNGWYYLTPENSKPTFDLNNSFIVNYNTGEIIRYDENKHRFITNELKCITEGLVYAADPKNMTDGNSWGDAILHNFNEGDKNSGWTENSLMFDGIDDGIEVYDSSDYSHGVTLEIYLNLRGKTDNQRVQLLIMKRQQITTGFFMFLGNDEGYTYGRLSIDIGVHDRFNSNLIIEENTPTYITYTYNPNAQDEKGILYVNGKKFQTTNQGNIDNLISIQSTTNIQIGSDIHKTHNLDDETYPFNGEIYAARVYNRPLTENEVQYNYNATIN